MNAVTVTVLRHHRGVNTRLIDEDAIDRYLALGWTLAGSFTAATTAEASRLADRAERLWDTAYRPLAAGRDRRGVPA
jgi:hypothetical protein